MEHGSGTLGLCRRKRSPAEGRVEVVRVHDVRAQPAYRRTDLARVEPTREQAERRPPASDRPARALEYLDVVPAPG